MWRISTALIVLLSASAFAKDNVGLVLGGYGASNAVELVTKDGTCSGFDINPPFPVSPGGSSAWVSEYVNGKIYLCGGQNILQRRDCYSFDVNDNNARFSESCKLETERRYPTSVVFNDQMLVMGGYNDDDGWLDSVEAMIQDPNGADGCRFETRTDWKLPRGMYNFCAVSDGDHIYTIGGQINNFFGNNDLDAFDILDTKTGVWTEGPRLPKSREAASCIITELKGTKGILVAGGCDNDCLDHLDDTLFYNFSTGEWSTHAATLNIARNLANMVDIDGYPTVIGGYDNSLLSSIEYFDGYKWDLREDELYSGRYAYGMPSDLPSSVVNCG